MSLNSFGAYLWIQPPRFFPGSYQTRQIEYYLTKLTIFCYRRWTPYDNTSVGLYQRMSRRENL